MPGISQAQPSSDWKVIPVKNSSATASAPRWQEDKSQTSGSASEQTSVVVWTTVPPAEKSTISSPPWQVQPNQLTAEPMAQPQTPAKPTTPLPPYTWPNGQPMSIADKKFYGTAYSRGSLIQIGDTIYPNLGFNALQRQPKSWGNASVAAIDNSFQGYGWASLCARGDFTSSCADAVAEIYFRLWNSKDFSLDVQWSIHSLSGGAVSFANRTGGTEFGEGQSLGFKLSKNLGQTFGLSFGGNRLIHLDLTTDLPKNLYLMGTKIIRTSQKADSPIFSISLGLMSDVYNPNTNLTTMQYPEWLLGGEYPSIFAEYFDKTQATSGRGYYPNVAGVSSAFVCADQSIFALKPISAANPNCIKQVYVGPVGSIGFAPWPWLGFYAMYTGNINLGVSIKPLKEVPFNISIQAVSPITGINPIEDGYFAAYPCAGQNLQTCRTRVGLFADLAF